MKKILVISWFFPPINSSEGLVTYKLLNNSKFEYDVYMQKNNSNWSYGKSDGLYMNKNINCIESEANSLEEFKEKAILYFKENMDKYDIVMTRSMPEVSHKIGLEIKKIGSSIIWIASFGDPIGNNPFTLKSVLKDNPYSCKLLGYKRLFSPMRILRSMRFKHNKKRQWQIYIDKNNALQKDIINSCDYVIYNSEYQKNYMLKDYSNRRELESKTIILPHSFDEKLYKDEIDKKDRKIIFSYLGHLDDIRTPHQLFLAIKKLVLNGDKVKEKVEFRFYGNLSDNDKLFLINNDLLDIVKIKKPVDYIESLQVMKVADWLIHIDANISDIVDENIFFAAKLADYIGAGRKILGITMVKGISADILREYNALVVENNAEEIFNYLYLIIYENYSHEINLDVRDNYDARKVAKVFDEKISEIMEVK